MCGISLPRDASLQFKTKELTKIDYDKLKKGDLIFFVDESIINHVAIYLGVIKLFIHQAMLGLKI